MARKALGQYLRKYSKDKYRKVSTWEEESLLPLWESGQKKISHLQAVQSKRLHKVEVQTSLCTPL